MKLISSIAVLSLSVTLAYADGASDGNRGLQAMQQGNYDAAIEAFTHAIKFGNLNSEDMEFAYSNRGIAFLRKADFPDAVADLDYARQLKPDDIDAQNGLIVALKAQLPAESVPNKPKPGFWHSLARSVKQNAADDAARAQQQQNQ